MNASESGQAPGRVAVVIRCHNEEAHIGRLLTGVLRQSVPPAEVVVVDSGSTDNTLGIASAHPVKIVRISPSDFSFGAACNVGLEATDCDIGVFVSAHCYPLFDNWLELLTAPFGNEKVALTYGKQVAPPDGRFSESRLFSQWFPDDSVDSQTYPFCNNANAAIRLSLWREGLRYDESLTGLEDMDWAKRALADDWQISYVAEAPVAHVHDESWEQLVNRYQREAIAHRRIYGGQAMRLRQAVRLSTLSILRDFNAARKQHALLRNIIDIPRFRAAQYLGTFRGFRQSGDVDADLKHRFYYPEQSVNLSHSTEQYGRPIDYGASDE